MNPQATWDQLLAAYAAGDWDAIEKHAILLNTWLSNGGLPPRILQRDDLGQEWDRTLAEAGCRLALQAMYDRWQLADPMPCAIQEERA